MRPEHELAEQNLTLGRFVSYDHLFVSLSGDARGIVDTELQKLEKNRRIAMTVNSFSGAIEILRGSNLISVLPYAVAAKAIERGDLIAKKVPIEIPPAPISIAWHTRDQRDVGLSWLREVIEGIIADINSGLTLI
jgi:DNA-binding transcriptional LysR family regulator